MKLSKLDLQQIENYKKGIKARYANPDIAPWAQGFNDEMREVQSMINEITEYTTFCIEPTITYYYDCKDFDNSKGYDVKISANWPSKKPAFYVKLNNKIYKVNVR